MFTKTITQRPTSANAEFNLMSDSRPVGDRARSRRGAWIGGAVGVFAVVAGGLWLARKPIAEGLGQSYCEGAGLECELNFSRLDFSGLTLVGLDVRGEGADQAAVRAGELAVDLAWRFPLQFTTQAIDGDDVELRLNLRGGDSVLGDLDQAVQRQMGGERTSTAPAPAMAFSNVRIIGETEWGEVLAVGRFVRGADGEADIEFEAPAVQLAQNGGELDFKGARLVAKSEGEKASFVTSVGLTTIEVSRGGGQTTTMTLIPLNSLNLKKPDTS